MGLLEANDLDSIDAVTPFMGAIVYLSCGSKDTPDTETYAKHVDMFHFARRDLINPGWYE